MPNIAPSDIYPVVRRFLMESGLTRALKSFDKETSAGDDAEVSPNASAFEGLALTEAVELWLEQKGVDAPAALEGVEAQVQAKKEKKRKDAEVAQEEGEQPKKHKRHRHEKEVLATAGATDPSGQEVRNNVRADQTATHALDDAAEEPMRTQEPHKSAASRDTAKAGDEPKALREPGPKGASAAKKTKVDKVPGVPFSRVDHERWTKTIKDDRLKDNSHKAKVKFGESEGDSWADKAAEDMLKVRGRGFRKEMAKKKRASWRGAGEIDQGVNSIAFSSDSE